jgi:integrase/recombinase XerD
MPGRQAKIITPSMLRRMLSAVGGRRTASRDRVIILLSVKAGLRACEIARLDWSMVLDARGRVADCLAVRDAISKKRGGRRIPMHPSLGRALVALKRASPPVGPVVRSARGGGMRPTSIVNWFAALFASLELEGCSSHSGRRSFIPRRRETRTRPAAACATSSCWRATSRSRSPRAISTATRAGSGGWLRRSSCRARRDQGSAAAINVAAGASKATPCRRRAGENKATPQESANSTHEDKRTIDIRDAARCAAGLAAVVSAIVIGANKPCDAPA